MIIDSSTQPDPPISGSFANMRDQVSAHSHPVGISFSCGELVFAKSGQRPHWPARILLVKQTEKKCQVYLYNLEEIADVKFSNMTKVDDESRAKHGKISRNVVVMQAVKLTWLTTTVQASLMCQSSHTIIVLPVIISKVKLIQKNIALVF